MQKGEMRLVMSLGAASSVCPWSCYALFRDNVQHFLEGGQVSPRFRALHSLEQAVAQGLYSVDAARLRGEVLGAVFALRSLRFQDAAISLRSRAIMTGGPSLPRARGTVRADQVRWALPVEARAEAGLLAVAKPFLVAVLAVTEAAVDGDFVEVRREGALSQGGSEPESGPRRGVKHSLLSMGLAALLVACGSTAAAPPVAPTGEEHVQITQEEQKAPESPPIVAPPPAYGNKIVRAEDARDSRS